jgi:hypothetical protein
VNYNDQLFIFGGASSNLPTSGTYCDVWMFDFINKFKRMPTLGTLPSPRANFGMVRAGQKILVAGGRSSNHDPTDSHQAPFEVFLLNPKSLSWTKVVLTSPSDAPQYRNGVRCILLSPNELLVVGGLIPRFHNWNQEFQPDGSFENFRTSMQISILKFTDESLERGNWHKLAEWQHNRRGFPIPRGDFHLADLGNNHVLLCGGKSTNHIIQDVWILKITRQPSYGIKFIQVTIENPLLPSLPMHIFPSCHIGDLLVFTGVRTIMKKPGIEKPKEEQRKEPEQVVNPPSTSNSNINLSILNERRTPIFINHERPINTIGAMAAFSVSSQPAIPPQKVLKIQQQPEPAPEPPKKLLQDYPMRIFCLDLSCIMNPTEETLRSNPTVRWLNTGGLYENAPELRAHGTLTQLDNGLVLIGGVRRSQTDDDVLFTQATNEVYVLEYIHNDMT